MAGGIRRLLLISLAAGSVACGRQEADPPSATSPNPAASRPASPAPGPEAEPPAGGSGPYGAIAVSSDGNYAGFSDSKATRAQAEASAVRTCRSSAKGKSVACESQLWFQSACGALATGDEGAYGTGWGDSPGIACRWAVRACRDAGGKGCEGSYYQCSPRKLSGTCDGRFRSYK